MPWKDGPMPHRPRAFAALTVMSAALLATGCGLNAGSTPNAPVQLTVTRDFGAVSVLETAGTKVAGSDTAVAVARRGATVVAAAGARTVQSINGIAAGAPAAGWYPYINGILDDNDEATDVHGGDRVWWDQRPGSFKVRVVVGSYPEPFVHGFDGKRLPVRVECADPNANVCNVVANKLIALGVPIGRSNISRSAADESLRILVGPWKALRGRDLESDDIDAGPRSSGVFARFDTTSTKLIVLDAQGAPARTLGPDTGLIAATQSQQRQPVWFVTGTDDAGVDSAGRALDEGVLSDRYALAISHDLPVAVPSTTRPGAP
jgi:hypothetical protein